MADWNAQVAALNTGPFNSEFDAIGNMISLAGLEKQKPQRSQFELGPGTPTITETLSPELQRIYDQSIGTPFDVNAIPGISDTAIDRNSVRDALVARQEDAIARDRENARADLIARGIPESSEAFSREMDRLDRMTVDARQQAELGAGQAQQQALDSRRQLIQEALLGRQTPINELASLRSGSQVTQPNFGGQQIGAPNIMGAMQSQYGADVDRANFENAQSAQQQQAAATIIAAFLMSDRRLKTNIVRVGEHPFGIGIYEYDIFGRRERGVMAQELLEVYPEAVKVMPNGYYGVNYEMIGGRP